LRVMGLGQTEHFQRYHRNATIASLTAPFGQAER